MSPRSFADNASESPAAVSSGLLPCRLAYRITDHSSSTEFTGVKHGIFLKGESSVGDGGFDEQKIKSMVFQVLGTIREKTATSLFASERPALSKSAVLGWMHRARVAANELLRMSSCEPNPSKRNHRIGRLLAAEGDLGRCGRFRGRSELSMRYTARTVEA